MVCVFFVLSGFVLSYQHYPRTNYNYLKKSAIKRYLRLFLSCAILYTIVYLLFNSPLNNVAETKAITKIITLDYSPEVIPNFWEFLSQLFGFMFDPSKVTLMVVLWSISFEFLGSMYVFGYYALKPNNELRQVLFLLFSIIISTLFISPYISAFFIGSLLCFLYKKGETYSRLSFLTLIIGVFFGSFPPCGLDRSHYIFFPFHDWFDLEYFYLLGAALIVFSVVFSPRLQRILSLNVFNYLGKISFALYLVHYPIIYFFSNNLVLYFSPGVENYWSVAILNFILTFGLVIILSHLIEKYIDAWSVKMANKFGSWFLN